MKLSKKVAAFLILALLLTLLPVHTLAAGNPELSTPLSLTVSYQDGEEKPLTGAAFHIYLVSTMDENGVLTPTADFSGCDVDPVGKDSAALRNMAFTLESHVLGAGISPTQTAETNEQGHARFPAGGSSLTAGLYLVLGELHIQYDTRYTALPFLVMLPGLSSGNWVYNMATASKYESHPDESVPVTRKVLKVWKDQGHELLRPRSISVSLYCDGELYETVILSADTGWSYTWEELDGRHDWTVSEEVSERYHTEITREGITFVITNTYNTPTTPTIPGNPNLPQTGQLWWPVPTLFAVGLLFVVIGLAQRRGGKHE